GMISQLSQPSNGRKATSAQTRATKPTSSEAMLNMARAVPSFGRLRQLRRTQQGADVKAERDPDRRESDEVRGPKRVAVSDRDEELECRGDELEHPERRIRQAPGRRSEQQQWGRRDDASEEQ